MKLHSNRGVKLRKLIFFALCAVIMIISKEFMRFLPNIEPVTLIIILISMYFGFQALIPVYVFVFAEGFLYGFGMWFFAYLYVWAMLVFAVVALRRFASVPLFVILAGVFGLLFGTLCSLPYFITGGWATGLAWIVSGIPFDLLHCLGNCLITALLCKPLNAIFRRSAESLNIQRPGIING